MSKTIQEVHAQYDALRKTLALMEQNREQAAAFFADVAPDSIIAIGCGSSFQLSESIALTARLKTGVAAAAVPGGDIMLNLEEYAPLFTGRPMVVTVSRSGSTSEVVYTLTHLKERCPQLKTVCIACVEDSALAALSDYVVEIPWAFDESVCQTRSVTNLYAAAVLFIASAVGDEASFAAVRTLAERGDGFMAENEQLLRQIGEGDFRSAAVLCDGESCGVASEAALAFNEIAYVPSMFKHVLDVRHGPIVLFDEKTLVIIKLNKEGFDYGRALTEDVLRRGAKVILVSEEPLPAIPGVTQLSFGAGLAPSIAAAILLPVAQLIAYYHALAIGNDPDQPEGLEAWIKL